MSEAGERLIDGMEEALAISRGDTPAPRIRLGRHNYVPEGDGWNKDMSSAPRDGTVILIRIDAAPMRAYAARWHQKGCWEVFPGGFWTTVHSWRLLPD